MSTVSIRNPAKMSRSEAGRLGYLKSAKINKQKLQKRISEYNLNPKKCKQCDKALPYKERIKDYCNHSCCATFNNAIKTQRIAEKFGCKKTMIYDRRLKPAFEIVCKFCSNIFQTPMPYRTFCSQTCRNENTYQENITKWKNKEVKGHTGKTYQVCTWVRKYLREKYGNKCCKCGWCEVHPITKKVPLDTNHIDGNAKNTWEENLELICLNCHALTINFRALNKNSPRQRKIILMPP